MNLETTDQTFEQDVLKSNLPVLVDFWADWCGPCKLIGPIIEKVAEKSEGKAKVFKINVDDSPLMSSQYDISSIPCVLIFRDGVEEKRIMGAHPEKMYLQSLGL